MEETHEQRRSRQKKDSLKIIEWLLWAGLIFLVLSLFLSCATTKTYIVTNDQGTDYFFGNWEDAIEFHDKENYRNPLSVTMDSIKTRK